MATSSAQRFGDYEVVRPLSRGGMGDVLLARKSGAHGFEKLVAIKTLRAELAGDAAYRSQFNDEARLVSRLTHANIGQVLDYGDHEGTLYLVMEYVDGVSLASILNAHGRIEPRVAVAIASTVARALHYAHNAVDAVGGRLGVVHRDISPQNIMLTTEGAPKLIDFGIALMRNRETPKTVQGVKGKVGYMAPEQLLGAELDPRTDVFALGVVLHEALTGNPLFARDNMALSVTAVLHGEVVPPSAFAADVPAALDAVVMKALSREAAGRFADAAALAEALDELRDLPGPSLASFSLDVVPRVRAHTTARADTPRVTATATRPRAGDASAAPPGPAPVAPTRPRSRRSSLLTMVGLALAAAGALAVSAARRQVPEATPVPVAPAAVAVAPEPQPEPRPPASAPVAATPAPLAAPPAQPAKNNKRPQAKRASPTKVEPPAREPLATGLASFLAEPYAHVRIDGQQVGVTPLLRYALPVGVHRVELLDPETSRVRLARDVVIDAGKEARVSTR